MNFKPGDKITVQLSEKLEIGGDILFSAKFVAYHPNSDWCTVELEDLLENQIAGGGIKILNVPLHIVARAAEKKTEKKS